jgi:hypothetical protein
METKMKNKIVKLISIMAMAFSFGCSEYMIEEIKPEVMPGPIFFTELPDGRLLPPKKDITIPDGPIDLGDPLIPDIEVSFIQHDFGTHELTDPPVSVGLEIKNVGDYPLRINKIEQTLISSSFVLVPLANNELMPGSMEILTISYKAMKHGFDADTVRIKSNDPDESTVIIYVAGNGATPILDVDPTSVDFGAVDITSVPIPRTIDLINVGDGVLDITNINKVKSNPDINIITYPILSLYPGQKTSMEILYSPSDFGSDKERLDIVSNDPVSPVRSVSIKGSTADPDIDALSSIDFGLVDLGSSSKEVIYINNVGTGILKVSGVYFSNGSATFTIVKSFTGDILPGDSESIKIEYTPDDFNPDVSNIEVVSNDPDEPSYHIFLSGNVGVPEINVSPGNIDFGKVMVNGAVATQNLKISNVGTGKLSISSVSLKSGFPFAWTPLNKSTIDPGFSVNLEVVYAPTSHAPGNDELSIGSNDPQALVTLVPLSGWGSAPQLEIYPDPYDFGTEYLGCSLEHAIEIKNVGDMNLEVTNIEYFTSFPSHFSIDHDPNINGQFPWTIPPGSWNSIYIEYLPLDITVDSSFIKVHSNDPQVPLALSDQYGSAAYYTSVMDTFTQDTVMMSDILFIIDNSCSMGSWQAHVATNFDSFITVFNNSGVDYHIATITTDSPAFVGNIIDTSTVDPIAEFNIQAQVGTTGSGMERGLDMAYEALQPGADAAPGSIFERADAKMSLIFVSDEPDYSYMLPTSLDYSAYFKGVKLSSSKIIAHAVSGDCPSGCSILYTSSSGYTYTRWASCSYDYADVVSDMGGTQLSLCDTDWGLKMETLAKDSIIKSSFELSDIPIQKTIDVLVDGNLTGNWTFDPPINSVIFDPMYTPVPGSIVDISYNILGGC